MRRHRRILFWLGVALAVFGAVAAGGSNGWFNPPESSRPDAEDTAQPVEVPAGAQEARVRRIVDGDTLIVEVVRPGGPLSPGSHRVRLLEIDAPESVRPNHRIECGGEAAADFAREELPAGSKVFLQADREDTDEFGRYLRYVWDSQGEFFNEKAVAEGHARAVLYRPNDLNIDRVRQAEAGAKRAGRGIWGEDCAAAR